MIAISIILCSCNMKINTPKMPSTFNQNAVVTLGDFSFDYEICKDETFPDYRVEYIQGKKNIKDIEEIMERF